MGRIAVGPRDRTRERGMPTPLRRGDVPSVVAMQPVTPPGKLWPCASNLLVLAPMPLEMHAIVTAFGLAPSGDDKRAPWTGRVGNSTVTAIHIGMGPPVTRAATARLFDEASPAHVPVDHVMIAGICGGLSADLEVGTLINPEIIVEYASGATYRHTPPGDAPQAGKLITTEEVTLDREFSRALPRGRLPRGGYGVVGCRRGLRRAWVVRGRSTGASVTAPSTACSMRGSWP